MPKNVLWIVSDEFRPDCLAGRFAEYVKTPNLDALAAQGTLFERCYCQASPCAPSRMSMHTGRYMCSTGAVDNMTPLAEPEDNLAMWLRRHGRTAGIAGYNDYAMDPALLPGDHPHRSSLCYDYFLPGYEVVLDHEYDSPEWFEYLKRRGYPEEWCNREEMQATRVPPGGVNGHLPCHFPARYRAEDSEAAFLTGRAVEYIEKNAGQGWFLNLNYIKPHPPYISPAPYHAMYPPETVPAPLRDPGEYDDPHPYFKALRDDFSKRQFAEEAVWREIRACYFGMVAEIDHCVGMLVESLKRTGQWGDTMVIFGADHGTCLGDHFLTGKPHFYEQSVRVPLIVRVPDLHDAGAAPSRMDCIVENVDLAPTICEHLGLPAMPRAQGLSLLPVLRGASPAKNRAVFEFYYHNVLRETGNAHPAECRLWMLRNEKFKYVQFGQGHLPPMLFDLEDDPGETRNLAESPQYAGVVAECCQELLRWRIRNEDLRMEEWARQYR